LKVAQIRIDESDPPPACKLELVQVRQIPARERGVDRIRERHERVRRSHDEDPPWRRPQPPTQASEKVNPNLKPRPRHYRRTLRQRF
jgi:hypothetical protein